MPKKYLLKRTGKKVHYVLVTKGLKLSRGRGGYKVTSPKGKKSKLHKGYTRVEAKSIYGAIRKRYGHPSQPGK